MHWRWQGAWRPVAVHGDVQTLLGFTADDLLDSRPSLAERIHPHDQDIADALWAADAPPASGTVNLRLRQANARILCVRCLFERTRTAAGEMRLALTLQDAKSLPRTLDDAAITANFRAMMENTDDFIYFKDRNHVFTGASQTLVKVCSPAEHWTDLLGKTDYDVFPEAYADAYYKLERQVFQGLPAAREVQETLDNDGRRGWVDNRKYPIRSPQGELLGLFGIARDITEHTLAEQRLRVSEEQQRNLMHNLRVAVVVHAPDSAVVQANQEACRLLGLSLEQMQGKVAMDPDWSFVNEDGERLPLDQYPVAQVLATHQPLDNFVMGILHTGHDEPVWVQANAYAELDGHQALQRVVVTFSDITPLKQAQDKMSLAAQVFTSAREGIVITDASGAIVDANDTFTRITGYRRDEVLGRNPRFLKSGRQGPAFYAQMWQAIAREGHWSGEIWNRRKNGDVFPEMLSISSVGSRGKTQYYVALFSDITAIKAHQAELERMAHYDLLTGLPNRLLLNDRLNLALSQCQRRRQSVAVLFLDLDNIKAVNDSHGHSAGDAVLIATASNMQKTLRDGDTLARVGGDEFVAILVDLNQAEDCTPVIERLLAAAALPVRLPPAADKSQATVQVSASIGATLYPQDNADAEVLLRHADQAMYLAKLAGKNRYHLFDVAQDAAIHNRHKDLQQINDALKAGEFVLLYQPKVNMRTGRVTGAEALVRWQHPEHGLMPPGTFLPTLEDHPIGIALGEWVIDTALTRMATWRSQGLDLPVSVNIGAIQLQQDDFPQRLAEILSRHPDVPPQRLELEILETSALADIQKVTSVMQACRQLKVTFALDDFGTGYSSLTYLRHLPADVLKIDQSFVRAMTGSPDDLAIVKGVIGLAAVFHREVIAEGVETPAHGALLVAIGCDLAQGYGIARPMPADDFPAWAHAWEAQPTWVNPYPD